MKIVVDATILARDKPTGIDYYTRNLIQATAEQMPQENFELVYMSVRSADLGVKAVNAHPRRFLPFPERLYSGLLHYANVLPYNLLSRTRGDVYIFPNFSRPPMLGGAKSITFVYDLAFAKATAINTKRHKSFLDKQIKVAVRKSSYIVVCSQSTKDDLVEYYNARPSDISVIYPAANRSQFYKRPEAEIVEIRGRYNLPDSYILYVGTIEPRKNLIRLMTAYAELPPAVRREYPLVLAGGKGWLDEEIERTYVEISKKAQIIRTGYVEEADMPALYSGATTFVWPSLYEGFGMPVLEAMSCGVPVITSNTSSLPEVVGDAAIMVIPTETSTITDAMKELLEDGDLRALLSEKGMKQARKFSWKTGGEVLAKLIEEMCK